MQDYLATGKRRKEAGSRKEEDGRGGGSERKEVQDYLATGERRKEAGREKSMRK